jgi:hypothetical protein
VITDLDVRVDGVFHNHPDDIEMMLDKVGGPKVMLMSDACGSFDVAAYGWRWDDEAPAVMPNDGSTNICGTTDHRATDHSPGDNLPAPAPAGPYSTSLSAFDLTDPNGQYRLWVADDTASGEGFFTNQFSLAYTTRPRANTAFTSSSAQVAEGGSGVLTVRRTGQSSYGAATVAVSSAPGTASAGDFTPISRTLQFAPGETEENVDVSALVDQQTEGAETFTVSLSSPTGDAALGSPASATVTIPANAAADTVPPETTITKSPNGSTAKRKAKITFSSNEPGSTFECKLDRKPFKPCSSPKRLKKLDPGKHKFRVRATDAAGNTDPTPAIAKWKVRR